MEGGPQRANAAQLAARQIKARPKGRLQGGRPSTATGTRPDSSVQFAPVSQNGGGLFGGSVQGAGTFNFSAPGGMNFSTPSFGGNATPSPDVSDSEGRFPGDDRATKRTFGGPSTIQPSQPTFQPSNLFGQSQTNPFGTTSQPAPGGNSFSFGSTSGASGINFNQGTAPASNSFSFGGSSLPAPASPGISFGSGATDSKPANNPFSFGQQAAQPPTPSSPFTFGSSATQEKPVVQPQASNGLFNFGSPAPQEKPAAQPQASSSPFNFGSAATQEKPAATPFLFGQGSAAPSNSGINFGSTPTSTLPTSNLFGTSTSQSAPPTNMFASAGQQSAPANNIFGNLNAGSASANNLFGSREQGQTPSRNMFGAQSQQTPSTTNFFGTSSQPTTTSNLLGDQKQISASPGIFSDLNKPASTSNIFNSPVKQPESTNNLFGKEDQEPAPAKDLFPTLNKPIDDSVKQPKLNGNGSNGPELDTTAAAQSSSIFNKNTTSTSLFGQSPSLDNRNNIDNRSNGFKPTFSFGSSSSTTPSSTTNNIFSPMKPVDAPTATSQPPPSRTFSGLPQPTKTPQKEGERSKMAATPLNAQHSTADPYSDDDKPLLDPFNITDDQIDPYITKNLDDVHRHNYYATFRIKSLNKGMAELFENMHPETNPSTILLRYIETRKKIVSDWLEYEDKHKGALTNGNAQESPTKRPRPVESAASTQSPTKRKADDDENQENENPSKRNKEQPFSNQSQAVAKGGAKLNGLNNGTPGKALQGATSPLKPSSALGQNEAFSPAPPVSSLAKGKRKAEDDLTKDTQEASPLRQIKTPRLNGSTIGSNTSNLFKNILDSPSKSGSPIKTNPVKKMASVQESKDDTPRLNPFGSLPVPSSPTKSTASALQSAPTSTIFNPKANFTPNWSTPKAITGTGNFLFTSTTTPTTSNLFTPKATSTPATPFSPKPAAAPSNTGNPILKLPVFSATGGAEFISQFGQKSNKQREKEFEEAVQKEVDENYESDEDGPKDVYTEGVRARLKAAKEKSASLLKNQKGQGFVFKPSLPTATSNPESNGTKAEPELSHKAANATLVSTMFSQFSGQNTSSQGAATSALSSTAPSRTSTPGPFGSSTGSVFDAPVSTNSGPKNIFGHLSNTSSVKGNDDEDSAEEEEIDGDEENKDPNYRPDDDNPSSPGTPAEETGPGIASVKKTNFFNGFGTPKVGTPLGASSGTSTPTGGLFGRIGTKDVATTEKEQSGTTTPGGSLFDRITKDSNGNPIRHISTEEKENTQPSPANIFKDLDNPFNKTPGAPADKTWKPDSPIRFGRDATSDIKSSAPTVSITAATPTKTGNPSNLFGGPSGPTSAPFSNLFGSKDPKPAIIGAPFSNLFGSSSTVKGPSSTSVGFGFGAPSVTSSLLPSAAASATTSRATSPGATTDGESGVEGDPDAEHHDQINLTAGGPGEENEEVLYEVRAKAQKYLGAEEGWMTKGLGPLRILKHKDTKATRILLRADPSGSIVMNKGLVEQFTYEPNGKTVKVLTTGEDGKALETWLLQVKTAESAKKLAEVLESNKTAS